MIINAAWCFAVLEPHWDVDTAKYIITNVGDKFCELVEQEKEALTWAEDTSKSPRYTGGGGRHLGRGYQ